MAGRGSRTLVRALLPPRSRQGPSWRMPRLSHQRTLASPCRLRAVVSRMAAGSLAFVRPTAERLRCRRTRLVDDCVGGKTLRSFELVLPAAPEPASVPVSHRSSGSLWIEAEEHFYVPKCLHRTGLAGYEPETLACFLATIAQQGGPVFDVGANIGVFSLVAAGLTNTEVIAFEPTPALAAVARDVAAANDLRFTLEEIALGAESGTATFHLSDITDSSNSLLDGFRPSATSIEVVVDSLDDYVARTGTIPRVLKIDTEATEPDVLRGGLATIQEHRPWIVCEVLARRTETRLEEVLVPLGYTWYQLTSELPLVPRRELFGDRAYRFNNWLFAPEKPDQEFWERMGGWREALRACVPTAPVAGSPASPTPTAPIEPTPPSNTPSRSTPPGSGRVDAPNNSGPPARPARRKGVYGRKKLLAGIAGGAAFGAAATWVTSVLTRRLGTDADRSRRSTAPRGCEPRHRLRSSRELRRSDTIRWAELIPIDWAARMVMDCHQRLVQTDVDGQ